MDHLVTSLHLVSSRAPLNDSAVEKMGGVVVLQEVTGVGPQRSRGVPKKVLFFLETGNVFRWEILFSQEETIEVPATFYLETFSAFLFCREISEADFVVPKTEILVARAVIYFLSNLAIHYVRPLTFAGNRGLGFDFVPSVLDKIQLHHLLDSHSSHPVGSWDGSPFSLLLVFGDHLSVASSRQPTATSLAAPEICVEMFAKQFFM